IGKILIDPRDSRVVLVAAQGPLCAEGGARGLYRTTDGGATWTRVLHVDGWTGVNEVHADPRNPDVLYATSYQRVRRVWTLIDGGPGSGIHKSSDGGKTWRKLENGLPKEDMGRIGLAISPVDPDVVYAIVEAANKAGGVYRSTDAGGSWEKRSDYVASSPQYYQELVADPKVRDRVYSMDTWLNVTQGGGWRRSPSTSTTMRCGSTRPTTTTSSSAATAGSTRAGIAGRPGPSSPTCRSRSSTRSRSTRRCRSTTSTAAPRTTTRSAGV